MVQAKMVALGSMQVEVRMAREIETRGVVQVMEWCRGGGGGSAGRWRRQDPCWWGWSWGYSRWTCSWGRSGWSRVEWEAEKLKAS